jgi:zinc transporter ZupT
MDALLLTSMAAVSTSIGGYCAVALQRRVHLLMALGGGVLIGAASLDLLPSAFSAAELEGRAKVWVLATAALGALLIFLVGRVTDHDSKRAGEDRTSFTSFPMHGGLGVAMWCRGSRSPDFYWSSV